MKKLSGFDIGIIIAFVVVALLGGGAWWYLSGQLQDAQADVAGAKVDFDKYSTKYQIVVSRSNGKTLQNNIDLLTQQLDPLIAAKLQPKENTLHTIGNEDPVAWKHDLDDKVRQLTSSAKARGITLPPNFYFGFSSYLNGSPDEEQTAALSKQLLGIGELSKILINAPVKGIKAVRRTLEEDKQESRNVSANANAVVGVAEDHLSGFSLDAPGDVYTSYPFELEFETSAENLRAIMDSLIQSPYVFVVRALSIQNSNPNSPKVSDLDALAGPPPSSMTESSPGDVAATPPLKGPQFLFGNSTISVKIRIDLIEWNAGTVDTIAGSPVPGAHSNPARGSVP